MEPGYKGMRRVCGAARMNNVPKKPEEQHEGNLWLNIGKTLFLVVVLVAAWYILDWVIG